MTNWYLICPSSPRLYPVSPDCAFQAFHLSLLKLGTLGLASCCNLYSTSEFPKLCVQRIRHAAMLFQLILLANYFQCYLFFVANRTYLTLFYERTLAFHGSVHIFFKLLGIVVPHAPVFDKARMCSSHRPGIVWQAQIVISWKGVPLALTLLW